MHINKEKVEEIHKKSLEEFKKESTAKQKESALKLLKKIMREANYVKDEYEEELRMIAEKEEEVTEKTGTIVSPADFSNQTNEQGNSEGGGKFIRVEGDNFDVILNILIGIRRSLNNLTELPG